MRIAVTGPECTGKSTLSLLLSEKLKLPLATEEARSYLSALNRAYKSKDLLEIARGQIKQWEILGNDGIVADTEMIVIQIWHEWKFGRCPENLLALTHQQHFDLYFLCDIDLPWENDPLRENPKPEDRKALFHLYKEELVRRKLPFHVVSGRGERRIQIAMEAIHKMLPS